MSVSNVGSAAGTSQVNWRSSVREAKQDFKQLFQAMQSGDLSGAQQAYSALQQLQANNATSTAGTSSDAAGSAATTTAAGASASSNASTGNTLATDWTALGQALQSGNLTSAQSTFSQLEQDLQAKAQGAGHHHHHHDVDQAQASNSAMQAGNANGATASGGTNTVASDISALQKALQSGDTSSAQTLLTQLQNDLQASGQTQGQGHHHHHRGFATQSPVAAYTDSATSGTAATAVPAATATGSGSSATA